VARDLLRGDVVDAPQQAVAVAVPCGLRQPLGEPEVGEVDVVGRVGPGTAVEQDVGWLHVAMHEAARVRRVERARHLRDDADGLREAQRAGLEPLAQVPTLHVAHGDEQQAICLAGLVDRHDVGVVDRRRQLRLAQEALAERLIVGEAGGEQLQRNGPPQPAILREVDHAHAAAGRARMRSGSRRAPFRPAAHRSRARAHPHGPPRQTIGRRSADS
jgi:hypothetical protein